MYFWQKLARYLLSKKRSNYPNKVLLKHINIHSVHCYFSCQLPGHFSRNQKSLRVAQSEDLQKEFPSGCYPWIKDSQYSPTLFQSHYLQSILQMGLSWFSCSIDHRWSYMSPTHCVRTASFAAHWTVHQKASDSDNITNHISLLSSSRSVWKKWWNGQICHF